VTVLVLMGVSGCGKTTVAELVARAHGVAFQEGDALHPPANVAKMSAGHPLTDEDRRPWLRAIAAVIDTWLAAGQSGLVTCSALKRAYRDILIGVRQGVRLVYLRGDKSLIAERMARRRGHFMPPALLDSQFATLEEPGADENPVVLDIRHTPDELARQVAALL
jgi:carbohydrate kinase (thermoresistant glucokinase family)